MIKIEWIDIVMTKIKIEIKITIEYKTKNNVNVKVNLIRIWEISFLLKKNRITLFDNKYLKFLVPIYLVRSSCLFLTFIKNKLYIIIYNKKVFFYNNFILILKITSEWDKNIWEAKKTNEEKSK